MEFPVTTNKFKFTKQDKIEVEKNTKTEEFWGFQNEYTILQPSDYWCLRLLPVDVMDIKDLKQSAIEN